MLQHPLSNFEILTWLTGHEEIKPILGGVFSIDTLPRVHHYEPTLYIVNTAKSSHPTGTHWVAILVGIETSEYLDTLGCKPRPEFIDILGSNYIYCSKKLQDPSSSACGYYCLYYGLCRAQQLTFERIVTDAYNASDYTVMYTVQQIRAIVSPFVASGNAIKRWL